MKKTIATILLFSGVVMGETTLFTDLSGSEPIPNGDITYNSGTFSGAVGGTYLSSAATTVAFTLNLTEALLVNTQKDLIAIDGDSGDVGLTLMGDGTVKGKWNTGTHGNAAITLSALDKYAYTIGDEKFVTLTITASLPYTNSGRGVQVYTIDGTCVYNQSDLATKNNTSFSNIIIDTGLISSVAIEPSLVEVVNPGSASEKAAAIGKSLETKVIPEPATATLSLLALAGLAARRRRR